MKTLAAIAAVMAIALSGCGTASDQCSQLRSDATQWAQSFVSPLDLPPDQAQQRIDEIAQTRYYEEAQAKHLGCS